MSKVLQEGGFGSLPSSTKTNPRDQVKSISIATTDLSEIRRMESGPYAVSVPQHRNGFPEIVLFLRRLHKYCCDDWKEARGVKILEAYDHNFPQKEKDPESFTLPCFINNVCFDKSLVDLDIPEDDDVPLILRQPFLSTAHVKIDIFNRKVTLRDSRGILKPSSTYLLLKYSKWRTIRRKLSGDNYGEICEDEAKRRNSGAKMKTFEENFYLLPNVVSSEEDTTYQRQLITRIRTVGDVAEAINSVSDSVIPVFKAAATELLESSGLSPIELTAKALAKSIASLTVGDASKEINLVFDSVIPVFKAAAAELLESFGLSPIELITKALAKSIASLVLVGYTEIKKRSVLTFMKNYVTLLLEARRPCYTPSFAYGILRRFLPEDKVESLQGLALIAEQRGSVFNVATADVDTFLAGQENATGVSLQVVKERPQLQEKEQQSRSRFGNSNGGRVQHRNNRFSRGSGSGGYGKMIDATSCYDFISYGMGGEWWVGNDGGRINEELSNHNFPVTDYV
ncbi:DEAD-box ATP-dependent RNA helicase 7 [Tanacetum coccineum]